MTGKPAHCLKHDQKVRQALIDSVSRQDAIEMLAGALRSAHRLCTQQKFGGVSLDAIWRHINRIGPG
jgi:hypothetical protein